MSALPDPTCHSQKRKIQIILKVPIDIELDVLGMPPTHERQLEVQELLKLIEDSGAIAISNVGQAELSDNIQVSSNQLESDRSESCQIVSTVTQIQKQQDCAENHQEDTTVKSQSIDSFTHIQDTQDKSKNHQEDTIVEYEIINTLLLEQGFAVIPPLKPQLKKRLTKRVLDSLNDGLAFAVNTVGTITFMGKLANYSWE